MKSGIALLLSVSACSAAVIQRSPQNGGMLSSLATSFLPEAKFVKKESLKPQLRANATREKVWWGPYVLTAKGTKKGFGSLDPNGQAGLHLIKEGVCKDCTVLSGLTGLVYEDGSTADASNGIYIHHILTSDVSKKGVLPVSLCDQENPAAPNNMAMMPDLGAGFIGGSEDTGEPLMFTSQDGSYQSGFLVGQNDKFALVTDLVNYNNVTKTVYVTMDIEYVNGHVGVDSVPNLMSVTGCKIAEPKISKDGPAETTSKKFPILVDGNIIAMKGHMHNGGDRMELAVNDKPVCISKPRYNANGVIEGMSYCDTVIPVKKGDWITMKSVYDLKKYPLRAGTAGGDAHDSMGGNDVMAMWTMTFALDAPKV